jgi:hypothetical protein
MISRSSFPAFDASVPEFRDALKAIVAVHFDCANAITVAAEMYTVSWWKK